MTKEGLRVENLSVHYSKMTALWEVTFTVPMGVLCALIGPNGAGKSTLIRSLLNLIPSTYGKKSFLGQPYKQVQKKIAYVPQKESVDWTFPINVLDLTLMGRYHQLPLFRRPREADVEAALRVLDTLGIAHLKDRQVAKLSGGQQQRLFLARALLQEADIYFLDEPFNGIDQATEQFLVELLKSLRNQGKTLVVVQHNLNRVEEVFDWTVLLNRHVIAQGPTKEVFTKENLKKAYGQPFELLEEALKLQELIPND